MTKLIKRQRTKRSQPRGLKKEYECKEEEIKELKRKLAASEEAKKTLEKMHGSNMQFKIHDRKVRILKFKTSSRKLILP